MTAVADALVIWHDVECGSYATDLELWGRLASAAGGPVLDVGAGTGRVALHLAGAGHEVVALDLEPVLLGALSARAAAAGLRIPTVVADAADFELDRHDFALVLVPMQTVQLLAGVGARAGLLSSARRHLRAGGRLAIALAPDIQPFVPAEGELLPDPDVSERAGWRHVSQPLAVLSTPRGVRLERRRESFAPDGSRSEELDAIELTHLDMSRLQREGAAAGFTVEAAEEIPATHRHVGSRVVMLRA